MIYTKKADIYDAANVGLLVEALMQEMDHDSPNLDHFTYENLFRESLTNDHHAEILLAFEGNKCVGLISVALSYAFYAEGNIGIINELYVLPSHRSKGVGKILLEAIKQFAFENKWKRLELTSAKVDRTHAFYLREGFEEIGVRYRFIVDASLKG
ncbi:MAG: GNAT family N-acetyltransferase [Fimbriimonadaceae bacterium]|nr:GNAT family N-acetyltransferase [Chitinophagales bacterium]